MGNNESMATKNAGESLVISIAMAMQRYNAGCIARWRTFRASLEATGCRHQLSACTVLPQRPPWSTISVKITKHYQKTILATVDDRA